ncbi:MAG TPA: DUF2284 domain-containing protein [Paludibacter sp.]|nr:DUF2284 domain-containing protein [Paludibacter sp.]
MISKEKIETILADQGLADYRWITPRDIVVAQWVRVKCMFGCSDYGTGTCPPHTPSVTECERFFGEYQSGIIIRLSTFADKNAYPTDWSKAMTEKLLETEKKIFVSGQPKVFLLNQTCCTLCKTCVGNRHDCKDKSRSRPSPESFAVDVYQTARNAGYDLNVMSGNPGEMNRIAMILIE